MQYRFMFLAFMKNNSTISIERHAMDGSENNKKIIHEEVAKMVHIRGTLLHYVETTDILFVSNKNLDTIACFEKATGKSLCRL